MREGEALRVKGVRIVKVGEGVEEEGEQGERVPGIRGAGKQGGLVVLDA